MSSKWLDCKLFTEVLKFAIAVIDAGNGPETRQPLGLSLMDFWQVLETKN